jgi:hypothetical protein
LRYIKAIKKFFQFLDHEKGVTNETVLKSFQREWTLASSGSPPFVMVR